MYKKNTFLPIFVSAGLLLTTLCAVGMYNEPGSSQASSNYTSLTSDDIETHILQVEEFVRYAQQQPTAKALDRLADFYFKTQDLREQFTDLDKERTINTIAPLIDTLVSRNDSTGLNAIAFIFVRTPHALKINSACDRMSTAQYNWPSSSYAPHSEQMAQPSAPSLEPIDQTTIALIEDAVSHKDIAQLTDIAEVHPEYAALINDAIASLTTDTESVPTLPGSDYQAYETYMPEAPMHSAHAPYARVIEEETTPLLTRRNVTTTALVGSGLLGLYLWHRVTHNTH